MKNANLRLKYLNFLVFCLPLLSCGSSGTPDESDTKGLAHADPVVKEFRKGFCNSVPPTFEQIRQKKWICTSRVSLARNNKVGNSILRFTKIPGIDSVYFATDSLTGGRHKVSFNKDGRFVSRLYSVPKQGDQRTGLKRIMEFRIKNGDLYFVEWGILSFGGAPELRFTEACGKEISKDGAAKYGFFTVSHCHAVKPE